MSQARRVLWVLVTICSACGPADLAAPPAGQAGADGDGTGGMAGAAPVDPSGGMGGAGGTTQADPMLNPLGRARCQPPAGFDGSPQTIEAAVQVLDALPKPTSVACFVESLARPLFIYATNSVFSAQPALSTASPRVFIKLGRLSVSVVVDGESSYLMEFGYRPPEAESTSVKGELAFPLKEAVAPSAPYDRVRWNEGTVCAFCHYGEERVTGIDFAEAYASAAFRPRPETRVPLETLRAEHASCDWSVNPHRCEMLSAIFGGGTVNEAPFPDDLPTFY